MASRYPFLYGRKGLRAFQTVARINRFDAKEINLGLGRTFRSRIEAVAPKAPRKIFIG